MTLFKSIRNAFIFLAEGAYRIFSPHDDAYPETGVQPFSGDVYTKQQMRARARAMDWNRTMQPPINDIYH